MSKHIHKVPEQIQVIARTLAAARASTGLSQVELARQLGVPQSHLSRLETGKVDLRTSSLLELARLLDLEVMLVPRQWVPAVGKLTQGADAQPAFLYRLPK